MFERHIASPLQLRWVKGVCVFFCNLSPALPAEWQRSFTCICHNTGAEPTPNKSQHRKLTVEKTIFPLILPAIESAKFWSRVLRSTSWAILIWMSWLWNSDHESLTQPAELYWFECPGCEILITSLSLNQLSCTDLNVLAVKVWSRVLNSTRWAILTWMSWLWKYDHESFAQPAELYWFECPGCEILITSPSLNQLSYADLNVLAVNYTRLPQDDQILLLINTHLKLF